ncbi:ROK family protein [Alteribacter natronophilus]|uniref:ROK family protein n=1 Tax=Alteribacter natronophilus TaxID=2583810 RepID=UPI00110DBBA0|nr:ROK family protein [Alteribacter natronophilus]TMW72387.1 ROK family protein [Alteribacter natronophilus]
MTGTPAIGVDIGGTNTRVAAVDRGNGTIIEKESFFTDPLEGAESFLTRTSEAIEKVMGQIEARPDEIGVGCPGPIDPFTGTILDPPNLAGLHQVKLKDEMERMTGMKVTVDNDANAAALAETHFGAASGEKSAVYVTVSTGVGGGITLNGRLVSGKTGNAGEIGNMIVDPGFSGEQITSSGHMGSGTLERLASGTAIGLAGKEQLGLSGKAEEVFELAGEGNSGAQAIIDRAIGYLAIATANLANTLDPDVFVFGGGVMKQKSVIPKLAELTRGCLYPSLAGTLDIRSAALGQDAGVIGAALLPTYRQMDE